MAYSNWGAFVYRDGKRRRDCEDVPVFGDRSAELAAGSAVRIFVNLLKLKEAGRLESSPWWQHAHHAVLGDGAVRLCGYKSYPELWVVRDGAPEKVAIDWDPWSPESPHGYLQAGQIDGYKWQAEACCDPEAVELLLTEPDGTTWSARSGYCIGAGHDEDPDPPDEQGARPATGGGS